ncbi:MAG: dihydrofolate reductase family protein [Nitrococcus mobilis]|nr:dihydrofolate reductase family protein [Nitrococcus mobilis]
MLRLYPQPVVTVPLKGLYLGAPLVPNEPAKRLFVYGNFVMSLDGRIAIAQSPNGHQTVPNTTANPRDWRLFQELAGHADVLISSGRYLRDLAAGQAQDSLPIGSASAFADIRRWRRHNGLAAQPDVVFLSEDLDFPLPQALLQEGRAISIFTANTPPREQIAELAAQGVSVERFVGNGRVDGKDIVARLTALGYRRAYCVAGPQVLHTLVSAGCLDTLFLTTVHRLLGGADFSTIMQGALLDAPLDYRLRWLYYDAASPADAGQMFARYDRR